MSGEIMETWLFDSLLVTTVLMAVILLVRRPVAQMFGPGVAYALWLIPAARLVMPGVECAIVPATDEGQAVRDAVRESILASVPASDATVTTAATQLNSAPSIDFAALGVAVWLGGAALFFIVQMIRYASMRDDLLSDATEIANIDGVSVVASDQVAGPLAFGLFQRFIAVPLDFTKTYSPAERELAIAHEMAHHKSGDLFANLAAFIVLCLQWFNPVAWMSWNAFRFDQEAACDARVLAGKGAEERVIYGKALARTAFDGVPTFATALNSPKTIIERLRRLTLKDASSKRRVFGKIGVIAATAIILPLTATVVPRVVAQDRAGATADAEKPKKARKTVQVIRIKNDDKTVDVVGADDAEVTRIDRDGKTFVLHTNKKLSEDEAEKIIEDAEKSREDADEAWSDALEARLEADAARIEAEASAMSADDARAIAAQARAAADVGRREAIRVMSRTNFASYVPEIDIREVTKNCKVGQPVTTNVHGFDGNNKSTVRIVMCGKGQAKVARIEALNGLREARADVAAEKDMPEKIRKDVIERLEQQIRKLEADADKAG